MRRIALWGFIGAVLLAGAAWSQSTKAGKTEQAIVALEHQWLQSQQTNNTALVAPLLADHFVETSSEGKVTTTKAEALESAKAVKWHSVEYENVIVYAYGDTAVATGGFRGVGADAAGKPIDEKSRFTDTWVKMPNGQWQCVASQDTLVK